MENSGISDSKKREVIDALVKSKGIVTEACLAVNISRDTYYRWLDTDPVFAKGVEQAKESAIDFVEGQLYKNIEKGLEASTIFYMKTRGRNRGYAEKIDINHEGIDNININVSVKNG